MLLNKVWNEEVAMQGLLTGKGGKKDTMLCAGFTIY